MVTLIGTPPNIIIATIREQELGAPFMMFDFAPVGLVGALAGLFFVAVIGWRLIPTQNLGDGGSNQHLELEGYITELTVPEESSLIDKLIADLSEDSEKADVVIIGLLCRHGVNLLGISRGGKRIEQRVRRTIVTASDILLLHGPSEELANVAQWLGGLPLADRGLSVTLDNMTWIAAGIFVAAIAASSFGLVYLPIALGLVVALYVLAGIMPIREVYNNIEWPVVVLLGSMIPLGAALDAAGGIALIAGTIVDCTQGMPAWAVLAVLLAVTMTLSDVLNNTATTIVAAPITISIAHTLEVNTDPFLMAVAVAASCAFLTPSGIKKHPDIGAGRVFLRRLLAYGATPGDYYYSG